MALSDTTIRTLKLQQKPFKVFDREGLFLLVSPNGSKLWRWRYKFDRKEKLMALGEYPAVSLAQARERQMVLRKTLVSGVDPMSERKAKIEAKHQELEAQKKEEEERRRRAENSFENVARKWWTWWAVGKSPRHAGYVLRRLEADVFPAFGHMFIDSVTAADIRKLLLAIEKRDARDVAKRAHETSGQIFRYAIAHGIANRNPAADFKPSDILSEAKEENFSRVDAKDLPTLLRKMQSYDGDAVTRLAMRLLAYTFVRTSELIEAEWQEFDLDGARWDIPAVRMKMKTPHIIPLSRQSVEILRALKLLTSPGKLVFPGANDKNRPISNNTILFALYRLGYKGKMTGHGFRGLASTILNENGFEEAHIELQLAHTKRNKVAAAYNHAKYLKQRTAMMQWWADFLDTQRAKADDTGTDPVLKFSLAELPTAHVNSQHRTKQPIVTRARGLRPTA